MAFGTGNADVIGEQHNSEASSFQQGLSVQNQRILYEMRFTVISYSIVGVCKTDFEGWPGLRNFVVPEVNGVRKCGVRKCWGCEDAEVR